MSARRSGWRRWMRSCCTTAADRGHNAASPGVHRHCVHHAHRPSRRVLAAEPQTACSASSRRCASSAWTCHRCADGNREAARACVAVIVVTLSAALRPRSSTTRRRNGTVMRRFAANDSRSRRSSKATSPASSRSLWVSSQSIAASSSAMPRRCARSRSTAARDASSSTGNPIRMHCDNRERRSGNTNASPSGICRAVYNSVMPAARARLWKSNNATSSSRWPAMLSTPSRATRLRPSSASSASRKRPAAACSGRYAGVRPACSAAAHRDSARCVLPVPAGPERYNQSLTCPAASACNCASRPSGAAM